jgi:tetratricopeptide (TPR) repeat protein
MPYMEQAAVFSLATTPDSLRDSVRAVFAAPPIALAPRRILALLETRWRSAREGWAVLSQVPPTDSVVDAWIDFAEEAEGNEAWLTARDAFAAAAARRPAERRLLVRAATAALTGGEAAAALALLRPMAASTDSADAGAVALLEVRALAALGRAAEIERVVAERAGPLGPEGVKQAQRTLAWAWIRSGDLVKARAALLAGGGGTEEDLRVEAWLALYDGDFRTARGGLRRTDETSRDVVTAMALLSRTRADFSPPVGAAFLTLARGDTTAAARQFEATADSLSDAGPFLLLVSARLSQASGDTTQAIRVWDRLLREHATAPEAPEAELDWARVLRQRGDQAAAIEHLEHLILTYTQSSLVPQARRELELARGTVPPGRA